ncbi:MAG: hypothetical protein ACP5K5_02090, partial [Candidatus Micrarchaeia archaeon]
MVTKEVDRYSQLVEKLDTLQGSDRYKALDEIFRITAENEEKYCNETIIIAANELVRSISMENDESKKVAMLIDFRDLFKSYEPFLKDETKR